MSTIFFPSPAIPGPPRTEMELESLLSAPTPEVTEVLSALSGDLVILGGGGKVGPTLAMMAAQAIRAAGSKGRVVSVSRWGDAEARARVEAAGVRTISADLSDPTSYLELPEAAALIFLAGQKFGTSGNESATWWANAVVPALASDRYRGVPTVAYSTGNIYAFRNTRTGGSAEEDLISPVGAYAQSCLAREEVFRHASTMWRTPTALFRLNYAVELRYGVLVDIALKVASGSPIDVTMPAVNVVWQGDSNAWTLRALGLCSTPARALNVTGPETVAVRRIASIIGERLGVQPSFSGTESDDALLSDAGPCHALFGYPAVPLHLAIQWTADWVAAGGPTWGKSTKFEQREGRF